MEPQNICNHRLYTETRVATTRLRKTIIIIYTRKMKSFSSLLLCVTVAMFMVNMNLAYQYRHFDDGPSVPKMQEDNINKKVGETLELAFRSAWYSHAYKWYLNKDLSHSPCIKMTSSDQRGKGTNDNFVWNFTATQATEKSEIDRLVFEAARPWERNITENIVYINVTVVS